MRRWNTTRTGRCVGMGFGASSRRRQVVLLHDLEGMAHKEVAELLDISDVSSRQHLFVARRLLRERLGTSTIEEYAHD
jgi:DNA-directed RNA polymerase specialized sigma24 family protein